MNRKHHGFSPTQMQQVTGLCYELLSNCLRNYVRKTAAILLLVCISATASAYSQNVTLSVKNASLKKVFAEIRKQTGYEFLYTTSVLKQGHPVDIDVKNASVRSVLDLCYRDQPFGYTIIGKTVVIKPDEKERTREMTRCSNPSGRPPQRAPANMVCYVHLCNASVQIY